MSPIRSCALALLVALVPASCNRSNSSGPLQLGPAALAYPSAASEFRVGVAVRSIAPVVATGIANYSVQPALPPGLAIDGKTGVLDGTPTAAAPLQTYVVTGTGGNSVVTSTLEFLVAADFDANRFAYSLNLLPGSIGHWRFDAGTGRLVAAGGTAASAPIRAVAHPLGDRLYVVEFDTALVETYAIDAFDGRLELIDADQTGPSPIALTISADGRFVYTGSFTDLRAFRVNPSDGKLTLIELRPIPQVSAIDVSADGQRLFVGSTLFDAFGVLVRDPATGLSSNAIGIAPFASPYSIEESPDGRRLYVASFVGSFVSVYDIDPPTAFLSPLYSFNVQDGPFDLEVQGDALWVASFSGSELARFVLDPHGEPVVPGATLPLPGFVPSVAPTPVGGYFVPILDLGVALFSEDIADTPDVQALRPFVTDLVLVPAFSARARTTPFTVALDAALSQLQVLASSDGAPIGTPVPSGPSPRVIASGPHGVRLAVGDGTTGALRRFLVDPATMQPVLAGAASPAGFVVRDVLFDSDGRRIWVASDSQLLTYRIAENGQAFQVDQAPIGPAPARLARDSAGRFLAVTDAVDDLLRLYRVGPNTDEPEPANNPPFSLRDLGDPALGAGAVDFEPGGRYVVVALELVGELRSYSVQPVLGSLLFTGKVGGLGRPIAALATRGGDRVVVADAAGPALHLLGLDPKGVPNAITSIALPAVPRGLVLDATTDDALLVLEDGAFLRYSIELDTLTEVASGSTGTVDPIGLVPLPVWSDQ